MIDVLESAEFVVRNSRNVTVDEAGCASAARYVLDACKVKPYTTAAWKSHDLHPKESNLDSLVCAYVHLDVDESSQTSPS
jgi:predicted RNase H-like nuclease